MMEAKTLLRQAIRDRLARMSDTDRRVESQVISRELVKLIGADIKAVAVYMPYLDEPNIVSLITNLLEQKFVICMPKVDRNHMSMHQITSLEDVNRNPMTNILEPTLDAPIDEAQIDCVIVPGRAFTKEGLRMGRGNGGYDRWITLQRKRNPKTNYIGVCFDCQIVQELPTESHDERMDMVITSTRTYGTEHAVHRMPQD